MSAGLATSTPIHSTLPVTTYATPNNLLPPQILFARSSIFYVFFIFIVKPNCFCFMSNRFLFLFNEQFLTFFK